MKDEDLTTCCRHQNVSERCMGVCTLNLDLDLLLLQSRECIREFPKFMFCASGESS